MIEQQVDARRQTEGPTASPPTSIDRRSGLSKTEFVSEYLLPLRPVILTDAIGHWKALGQWTPQMFKEQYGAREVMIDGRSYTVDELIDLVLTSSRERPAPYLRNQLIEEWAPELLSDIRPLPGCTDPNWLESWIFPSRRSLTYVELYIGGTGTSFPVLHYDGLHTHAFLMQLFGRKQFIVFSPEQSPYMYPGTRGGQSNSQVDDVEHPDLSRFPLFAKAVPITFVLEPGETLFVPSGWWHTTRMLSPCITVSANTANRANWKAFSRDFVDTARRHRSAPFATALKVYLAFFAVVQPMLDLL